MTRPLLREVERRPLTLKPRGPRVVIVPMPPERSSSSGLLVAAVICLLLGGALGVIVGAGW